MTKTSVLESDTLMPSANPIILQMQSITKEFPGVKALSDVSITVRASEIHSICGENGTASPRS